MISTTKALSKISGRVLVSLVIAITLLITLAPTQISLAHPPMQGGDQPDFVSATFVAQDGSSAIESQEAVLAADYLAANGSLEGLVLGQLGLTLAEGQSVGSYVSNAVNTPLASTSDIVPMWSVDLPVGTQLKVETRLSLGGGAWSDWVENPEAFYPVRDDQHGGSMIWVGGGQAALQFRVTLQGAAGVSPTLKSVTLAFNNTDQGPTAADIASQMESVEATAAICPAPKPPVVTRTAWGCPDGQYSPRRPPTYAPVTHVIIHHTATPNDPYQDWAQVVRSVWNYHANILWWGDVGYNYLIDPNGVIYEGRAGGDDVVGIADTFNRGAMALGFVGCYGNCNYLGLANAEPSQPMLDSGVAMMAWKLGQLGIDPYSVSMYDGAGMLPVIAGARDVVATYSPGDYLYNRLPWFRDATAQRINCGGSSCQITDIIFDKSSYAVGETIHVTARVIDAFNNPLSGAHVSAHVSLLAQEVMSNPFDLADLNGYYQGSYSDTSIPGDYLFEITAVDPYGAGFTPCTAGATTTVGNVPPPIGDTKMKVEPEFMVASWCSFGESTAVVVDNVSDVNTVILEMSYDPNIIQMVDADYWQRGVQVRLDGAFLEKPTEVLRNEVDTVAGRIYFEARLMGAETINGNGGLIIIDWVPQSPGVTQVAFNVAEMLTSTGQPVAFGVQNGTVEITPNCVSGAVVLQGRSDFSGVTVTSASGAQTTTDAEGSFSVSGEEAFTVDCDGYLKGAASAAAAAGRPTASGSGDVQANSVGSITLLAGDLNADDLINIFDLAIIANQFDTNDTLSDLNADGVVNILDVALIASNFGQQGPLTDWQ